jgi:hypothetical protein
VGESGMIRTQMGNHSGSVMVTGYETGVLSTPQRRSVGTAWCLTGRYREIKTRAKMANRKPCRQVVLLFTINALVI